MRAARLSRYVFIPRLIYFPLNNSVRYGYIYIYYLRVIIFGSSSLFGILPPHRHKRSGGRFFYPYRALSRVVVNTQSVVDLALDITVLEYCYTREPQR